MERDTPPVSIIIAAHNEGDNVERTLESILDHTAHPAYEVFFIDDGSTDESFTFLHSPSYLDDARIHHYRFDEPVGCIRARDQGASMAKGTLLVFLDAHMAVPRHWLTRLCHAHVRWGPLSAITPGVTTLNRATWQPEAPLRDVLSIDERFDFVWRPPPYPTGILATVGGCCVLLARSLYEDVGGFDLGLRRWGCEFIDLILKVYAAGGLCCLESSVWVGHLFREAFPYPMHFRDLTYNKLRVGYIHLSDASFSRLHDALREAPGYDEAMRLFEADRSDVDARRRSERKANRRDADWFVRMFLPALAPVAYEVTPAPTPGDASRTTRPHSTNTAMKSIVPETMERLARRLKEAETRAALAPDLVQTLHARFRALDDDGSTWTVGLNDLRWYRLDRGKWIPNEPPAHLLLDEGTWLAFKVLDEVAPAVTATGTTAVSPEQMQTLARHLQAALDDGRLGQDEGKALHARFRGHTAHGMTWTVGLRSLRWHFLEDGQWKAGTPPDELLLEASLEADLLALAPPTPLPSPSPSSTVPPSVSNQRTCPNPACGKPVAAHNKFCTACGTRVA